MDEKNLRRGLYKLEKYLKSMDISCAMEEKNVDLPLDTLLIDVSLDEGFDFEVEANYVSVPVLGNMIQYFCLMGLGDVLEVAERKISDAEIKDLANEINILMSAGQVLYLNEEKSQEDEKYLAVRYTMFTDLEDEKDLLSCSKALTMMIRMIDFTYSGIVLMADGRSAKEAINAINNALNSSAGV